MFFFLRRRKNNKQPKHKNKPIFFLLPPFYSQHAQLTHTHPNLYSTRAERESVLVDVSCGSGLFTRKFVKSAEFSRVIALDFSESMLSQAYEFLKADSIESEVTLIRADVARLPFATGNVRINRVYFSRASIRKSISELSSERQ